MSSLTDMMDDRLRILARKVMGGAFSYCTRTLDTDLRDGLRISAQAALKHRLLIVGLFLGNLVAALFEGGTIGILALAVSILVEQQVPSGLVSRFGWAGQLLASWLYELGAGGIFLILVGLAVSAQILKSLMAYVGKCFAITLQFRVSQEIQDRATDHIMKYGYQEITRHSSGGMSVMVGQTAQIAGIVGLLNRVALSSIMLTTYFVLMLLFSISLSLTAAVLVLVVFGGLSRLTLIIKELGDRIVEANVALGQVMIELLNAPRLLRVFGATNSATNKINEMRRRVITAEKKSASIKAIVDPLIDSFTILSAGAFLVIGYLASGDRALDVLPTLFLFLLMLNRMMPHAKTLNEVRLAIAGSMRLIRQAGQLLRTHDKVFTRTGGKQVKAVQKAIRLNSVSFSYPDTVSPVLTDITFSVNKGETVALVGGSGGGKSTVISLLLGLYDPTKGSITIDGADIRTIDIEMWRRSVGTVDQEVFLMNATIRENIAFATDHWHEEDIVNAARSAHAHEFIEEFAKGYDTIIGDRGFRLSGGQQQRLALARALLRAPDILILDEATSALDGESEKLIQQALEELHASVTVVVIAHRLSTITHANKVIVIEKGVIVEQGTPTELVANDSRFAQLWKIQSNERLRS